LSSEFGDSAGQRFTSYSRTHHCIADSWQDAINPHQIRRLERGPFPNQEPSLLNQESATKPRNPKRTTKLAEWEGRVRLSSQERTKTAAKQHNETRCFLHRTRP
jgi:hypothetical protein